MPASKQLVILVKNASVFQHLDWAGRLVTNRCGACKKNGMSVKKLLE